jgi:hypothetical protein
LLVLQNGGASRGSFSRIRALSGKKNQEYWIRIILGQRRMPENYIDGNWMLDLEYGSLFLLHPVRAQRRLRTSQPHSA